MASDETMEGYGSDEDSLAFSQLHTPLTQNPSKSPLDNATSGKILKIVLTNFMCHKHIEVTFHDNVNVILGRNGSGKSAIMAAIIVGLGGKATATSRNTSLQQFIRTGSNFAEIKLTLSNVGQDSYQPEVYGRRVVIVRRIQKEGSGYRIMSADGQTISNKKDELIKILDKFNIQVDNPVSLLNQETSRNFLHSTNPATLYQLLMKATQLDSILRDYEHTEEQEAIMRDTITKKKDSLKELEVEVKKLEELFKSTQGLESLGQKLNRCTNELKWAYVNEIEQEVELQEAKIAKEQERLSKNEAKRREAQEEASQMEAKEQEILRDLEQVNEETQTIEGRQESSQAALRARQKEKQKIQQTINGIKREIKSKQNERTALEKKIEETKQINFADHHAEHEQWLHQLEEAKQRRVQLLQEVDQCKHELEQHRDAVSEYGREHRQIMEQNDSLIGSIRDCRNSISKLQSSGGHNLDIFGGRWMVHLKSAIQNNSRRFHKQPMGPLGSMINIRDEKWTIPIQKCIGIGNLHAFVVDNNNDSAILRQIMKEVFQRERVPVKFMPFIIQYNFAVHAYSCSSRIHGCAHPNVLSQLNISNTTCRNVIVDHCKVESTILIDNNDEAEDFMLRPPSGVTGCYTLKGDQHLPGGRFYSNRDDLRRTKIYLAASKENLIGMQKDQLSSLEQEQRELEGKMEQTKRSMETAKSEQQNAQRYLSRLQQDEFRMKQRIEELTAMCEEAEELKEEDIATYEEEVRECNDAIDELNAQVHEHQKSVDATAQQVEEARKEVEAARNDADTLTQRMESIHQSHTKAQQQTRKVHISIERCNQHIDKIRETLRALDTTLRDINSRLSDAVSQAEGDPDAERIDTDRTSRDIISEIKQIEKTIKEQEKQLGNAKTIARDLNAALERYNTLESELTVSDQLLEKLKLTMHMRVSLVKRWRESVSTRITGQFHTLMSQRGVKGSMKVDHKKGELVLMVKFHEEQHSLATKNTKSLSGGERSFSTVALIMSLWEVTDSPFRILDEFDVFMDMMNRRISMTMMLELARKQPHKQFVFLSPQDMSTVIKGGDYMKIIKMDDPDRSQTTLD